METLDPRRYMFARAFQVAAEESGSLVFLYDLASQTILLDAAAAQSLGISERQEDVPYGPAAQGIVTEDTRAEYVRIHRAILDGAEEAQGIVKLIGPDGGPRIMELRMRSVPGQTGGASELAVGVYRDITDHSTAYGRLRQALEGLREEFLGVFEIDLERDRYHTLSYDEGSPFPVQPEGEYQRTVAERAERLVDPDHLEDYLAAVSLEHLRALPEGEDRVEVEYRTAGTDRAWRRAMFCVTERREGRPVRAYLYQSDIDRQKSERLRQQEALRESYRYAEAASRAKSEFLSRMSHDIRTPMNAIIGMTAIAGAHLEESGRVKDCLGKIATASRHLLDLINEVLDMSKIESGAVDLQNEEFDLGGLMDECLMVVMGDVKRHGHDLTVDVGDLRHERVLGDPTRLRQVFLNLLSNAVKYTPDGGRLRVTMRERPSRTSGYGKYEFVFEDNGIGMTQDFQRDLFQPFSRAEDSRLSKVSGTGLGLAITHNLVHMMGGDILVESRLDHGSRFTVQLALKILQDDRRVPSAILGLPVLVVDDDAASCESAGLVLSEIGLEGEWCLSGEEAVERVRLRHQREEDYFAVILDWKMPGMDGMETARRIRAIAGPEVPIIFLSAYDWSDIEDEARAAGVTHFIAKPLFRGRLLASFSELLEGSGGEEEPGEHQRVHYRAGRVLLAEDNDLNAEIATELLEDFGLTVDVVEDGAQAVRRFEQNAPGSYDLVLMDIQMPVMDGHEATRRIRGMDRPDARRIPIVAMSANAFSEDVERSRRSGMDRHISKPVDVDTMEQMLIDYLPRSLMDQEGRS